ncbi:MAG: glycosyltransferase 87 family protein [Chloroflexi bacterium]|nr:glycosyltransferase 87 family protein [Chloroflexota bacterium]
MSRRLALALVLLLGALTKLPGLAALDDYARRAYAGLWYSDLINLYNRDFWAGFVLPYRDALFEYPVLTGLLHALGGLSGSAARAFWLEYAVLAGCAVITTWALGKLPGSRPLLFVLSPALVLYAGLNWDLLAVAPLALACLAFQRQRPGLAGALLGVGGAAKLYPLAFLPALLAAAWASGKRRQAGALAGAAAGTVLALNLPVMLLSWEGWWYFYEFSAIRPAHSSLFNLTAELAARANQVGVLAVALGWGTLILLTFRRPGSWLANGAAMLAWWLLWNKVTSPQFSLYLVFLLAALGAPLPLAILLALVDVAYFMTSFQSLALWSQQQWEAAAAYSRVFVWPVVWARLGLLALLVGWVTWSGLVRERSSRPAPRRAGRPVILPVPSRASERP